jgi:Ricin-type beta-trefoil lectin domain-like
MYSLNTYQVVNSKSDLCLGVSGGSVENGAPLGQYNCSPVGSINNQSWLLKL